MTTKVLERIAWFFSICCLACLVLTITTNNHILFLYFSVGFFGLGASCVVIDFIFN